MKVRRENWQNSKVFRKLEIKIVKFSLHYFLISAKLEAKRREGCQEDVRALESEISVLNTQVESMMRNLRLAGGERYC